MNENSDLEFRKIKSLNYLYEINGNGTIFRNVKTKKELKIKLDYHHSKAGYYVTFVHIGGRSKNSKIIRVMIHKAVAECWLGDCPTGLEVDHIDRNSHNNDYHNLRYVTKSEQMKNRDHSGIGRRGALNFEKARKERMIPVILSNEEEKMQFESCSECARFLNKKYGEKVEIFRYRLSRVWSKIEDYDVTYLKNNSQQAA